MPLQHATLYGWLGESSTLVKIELDVNETCILARIWTNGNAHGKSETDQEKPTLIFSWGIEVLDTG